MRSFVVELKRTSYISYVVEATDAGEAEDKAWALLEVEDADTSDATWDVEQVWEEEL